MDDLQVVDGVMQIPGYDSQFGSRWFMLLDNHEVVPFTGSMRAWGAYFENANRHVGLDFLTVGEKQVMISTVFLSLDHGHYPGGPPVVFETMIFGDFPESMLEDYCDRYSTWGEAEVGHAYAVNLVRGDQLHEFVPQNVRF